MCTDSAGKIVGGGFELPGLLADARYVFVECRITRPVSHGMRGLTTGYAD